MRTIEVQGADAHGAVPSTQALPALMNVAELGWKPTGTGPPAGPGGDPPPVGELLLGGGDAGLVVVGGVVGSEVCSVEEGVVGGGEASSEELQLADTAPTSTRANRSAVREASISAMYVAGTRDGPSFG